MHIGSSQEITDEQVKNNALEILKNIKNCLESNKDNKSLLQFLNSAEDFVAMFGNGKSEVTEAELLAGIKNILEKQA